MMYWKRLGAVILSSCMVLTAVIQPGIPGCVITAYGQEQAAEQNSNEDKGRALDNTSKNEADSEESGNANHSGADDTGSAGSGNESEVTGGSSQGLAGETGDVSDGKLTESNGGDGENVPTDSESGSGANQTAEPGSGSGENQTAEQESGSDKDQATEPGSSSGESQPAESGSSGGELQPGGSGSGDEENRPTESGSSEVTQPIESGSTSDDNVSGSSAGVTGENPQESSDITDTETKEEATETDSSVEESPNQLETETSASQPESLPAIPEQEMQEEITLMKETDGYLIILTAKAGVLPEDAQLIVSGLDEEDVKIKDAVGHVMKELYPRQQVVRIAAFDVAVLSGGAEMELPEAVTLTIQPLSQVLSLDEEEDLLQESIQTDVFYLGHDMKSARQLASQTTDEGICTSINRCTPVVLVYSEYQDVPGWIYAGADQTAAGALEALSEEDIRQADGKITLCLTGNTADGPEVFVPSDKGIEQLTITGENEADYRIGASAAGSTVFANGVPLVYEHGSINSLYGGGKNVQVESTRLTITEGRFLEVPSALEGVIVGGSLADENGADVSIPGTCRITIESSSGLEVSNIYCGSVVDAAGVNALIGKTSLLVKDSSLVTCMVSGGSFAWNRADNSVLDAGGTYMTFEDSYLNVGYMDFTFSIFGGHIGNDEVENIRLNCDSTNITVKDSTIDANGWGGGEIFGGNYHTSTTGRDVVTLGRSMIRLENSKVNGVFAGGYYNDQCFAETGSTNIYAINCRLGESSAVDIPILCGGDIYLSDTDYGKMPVIGSSVITLNGTIQDQASVYAEGVCQIDGTMSSLYPGKASLYLDDQVRQQVESLDLDSRWTDVNIVFQSGKTAKITAYDSYDDLIERILQASVVDEVKPSTGSMENKVAPENINTPVPPQNSSITMEDVSRMKDTAVEDTVKALKQKAETQTVPDLANALQQVPGAVAGDQVSACLKMDLLGVELRSIQLGTEWGIVPQKLVLEVTPYVKIIRADADEVTQPVDNAHLSGQNIEFQVGVPDSVSAPAAIVVHHAANGDETQQVNIQQDEHGKFIRIHAASFSEFEITFVYGEEPAPDPPQPVVPGQHEPVVGSGDGEAVTEGQWIKDEKGWWYRYTNGTWPSSQWAYLFYGNSYAWYFFGEDGYMKDGWICWENQWYYLNTVPDGTRGALLTNTITPDGCVVGADGAWVQ